MALPVLVGTALLRGATAASLVKPAVGFLKRFFRKAPVRPGSGSKVTSGPLRVGKTVVYGAKSGGRLAVAATGVGAGSVGIASVASHRRATAPAPQSSPRRSVPAPSRTATGERKCCPVGTKRMVCFKRGRVKKAKARRKSGAPSAKQRAARARFAAAARAGRLRKGVRL